MEQLYDKNEPTALSSTSRVSRRSFVGSIVAGATGLYLSGALSGCHRGRVLRVANWADLIGPSTISDFEKEASCTVVYENYSANEELHTKLSRPDAYDVVFPSDYMVQQLAREKRLSQLPHNKFKNLDNLDKRLLGHEYDPTNDFAFPYTYWGTGIAVN